MSQTTINVAIQRFEENENKIDTFANKEGFYSTNTTPVKTIETLPSFIARMIQRYITLNFKGDWITSTLYQVNELVKSSSIMYICVEDHTSGTFATDLSAGKWAVYQGITSPDLESLDEGYGVDLVGRAMKTLFEVDDLDTTSPLIHSYVYVRCFESLFDGGNGSFDWDETSEATPVRGITHKVTGIETGRWIRQLNGFVTPQMFGAVGGDGSSNDTTALAAFFAVVKAGTPGVIPSGIYSTDPLTWDSSYSGMNLSGYGPNYFTGQFGQAAAVVKLRTASSYLVSLNGACNINVRGITFDGAGLADNVIYWPGLLTTTINKFEWCSFYGAAADTGITHRYDGTIQADHTTFDRCTFKALSNGTFLDPVVAAHVYITNSNALLNEYKDCQFFSAKKICRFGAGSANLTNCQFYFYTEHGILVDSVTQPFTCTTPYTEQTDNLPFFYMAANAGISSTRPIVFIGADIASHGAEMVFSCQQPVLMYGGFVGYGVSINPAAVGGVYPVVLDSVVVGVGGIFGGTGAITHVSRRNCFIDVVKQTDINSSIQFGGDVFAQEIALANSGATPSVANGYAFVITNTGAQNVSDFSGGTFGKRITVRFDDANTTLVYAANLLVLAGRTNVTPTAESVMTFEYSTGYRWVEVSRSIK